MSTLDIAFEGKVPSQTDVLIQVKSLKLTYSEKNIYTRVCVCVCIWNICLVQTITIYAITKKGSVILFHLTSD